ncbi:MAG: phosphoribosylglycinamide formyltransferase [Gemmatimonadaceae bacterium]
MMAPRRARGRARLAVLASGGGSNLQALLDHLCARGAARAADVVVVVSDRAGAGALERARASGVAAEVVPPRQIGALLEEQRIDLVALAGYLRFIPDEVTARFRGRMVNVHPSLLPAFGGEGMYGARVHEAVIAAGVSITGATVHFVDTEYDAGPIIAQWPVPVLEGDSAATLGARVLRVEHALFPRIVDAIAGGRVALNEAGRVEPRPFGAGHSAFAIADTPETSLVADLAGLFDRSRAV